MGEQLDALKLADAMETATAVINRLGDDVLLDFGDGTKTVDDVATCLRQQHDRIEQLELELDRLRLRRVSCPICAGAMVEDEAELCRDAERYRWLVEHGFRTAFVEVGTDSDGDLFFDFRMRFRIYEGKPPYIDEESAEAWTTEQIGEAIDAAMKEAT